MIRIGLMVFLIMVLSFWVFASDFLGEYIGLKQCVFYLGVFGYLYGNYKFSTIRKLAEENQS